MSTTTDIFECPQCGYRYGLFVSDTSICKEIKLCPLCGYYQCLSLILDRKRSNEDQRFLKLKQNGEPIQRHLEKPGYGVYKVMGSQGAGIVQRFWSPPTQRQIQRVINRIQKLDSSYIDWVETYVTIWDEANSRVVCVFGKLPQDASDCSDQSGANSPSL